MGINFTYQPGQTPIDEEEKEGLKIDWITTQNELDQLEQLNIEKAVEWTIIQNFKSAQVLSESFIKKLHVKMFGNVWKWAGKYRTSEKNIGIKWTNISIELKTLIDDAKFWVENETYSPEEIAIRFKHRLVSIHCFPNGNGRHSRIMADIILECLSENTTFTWGQSRLVQANEKRKQYIKALKIADNGCITDLIDFAKS